MNFTLNISTGNDAMRTSYDVAEALEAVRGQLMAGAESGRIMDINGNSVGYFLLQLDEEEEEEEE